MPTLEKKISSVLLPLANSSVLLPHSAMLDVLPEREITPLESTADWVLGEVSWSNKKIPLVEVERILGEEVEVKPKRPRLVILRCLSKEHGYQYIAIKTTGVPRLIQFEASTLDEDNAEGLSSNFIKFYGQLNNQSVVIPDMKKIETSLFIN